MTMLAFKLLGRYWKPLAVFLLFLVWSTCCYKAGVENTENKWQAIFSKHELQTARAVAAQSEEYRKREKEADALVYVIETNGLAALQEKQHELETLRAGVAADRIRLRVKARCPMPPAAVPSPDAGVDHGGTAELDPSAEPDYFALRTGIEQQFIQLKACQDILRAERR